MKTLQYQPKHAFASNVIVFGFFLFVAQVGTYFYREVGTSPAMIMAPAGIAIAAVILEGPGVWPAIALASIANGLLNGTPLFLVFAAAAGNTLQPLAAFFFLRKAGLRRKLATVKDMFLILGTSLFLTAIVPTVNAGAIKIYNHLFQGARPAYWTSWWLSGALSALILTPFLIRWVRYPLTRRTPAKTFEIILALLALTVLSYFLFATPHVAVGGFSIIYPLMAVLLWIAFRTDSRVMTLSLLLMTAISLGGALYGNYVPAPGGLNVRIFNTQVFDFILAAIFFMLVSVEEQRKQAIEDMQDRTKKLEAALERIRQNDEAKSEFIATLAHEMRNPLATFMSSVELMLLGQGQDPAETKRLAGMMQSRIQTMKRMLDDLLDVSRVARREMEIKKEPVSLLQIVRQAVTLVESFIQSRQQAFSISMPLEDITLFADPVRIEQILVNLLTNASKYTPEKGRISLAGIREEDWLCLKVSDTGIGIPPDMIDRIFEPFVRVKHDSGMASGIGIGLALTKDLVEMHGGTVTVRSDAGGSEFTVRLPIEMPPAIGAEPAQKILPQQRLPAEGLDVVVVDDNKEAARSMGKLLSLRGHRTALLHDGHSVLDYLASARPDVILLDVGLPDLDGYEVARRIKARGNSPALVALTGYGQAEDILTAHQAGFDHHLTKPVGLAEVEEVLKQIRPPA